MRRSVTLIGLSDGIRALRCFARYVPLDVAEFASLARLHPADARALIAAFEQSGFVRAAPNGALFQLTQLGVDIVGLESPLGPLLARGLHAVDALSQAVAEPATLSIRRGAHMLFCLASQPLIPGGVQVGTRRELLHCPQGLVQIACQSTRPLDPQANAVRRAGYLMTSGVPHPVLAVPIMRAGRAAAILSVHATTPERAEMWHDLLPIVREEADKLGQISLPAIGRPHASRTPHAVRSPGASH